MLSRISWNNNRQRHEKKVELETQALEYTSNIHLSVFIKPTDSFALCHNKLIR